MFTTSYARPPTVSFSFSKKMRWSCATSVSTNDCKKEVNATTSHQRAQIQAILMQKPHVGRIYVFPPLMDIHDCVSMRMGLILSQMPRLKEQVWWTKPPLHNLIFWALASNPALHSNRASSVGLFQVHNKDSQGNNMLSITRGRVCGSGLPLSLSVPAGNLMQLDRLMPARCLKTTSLHIQRFMEYFKPQIIQKYLTAH